MKTGDVHERADSGRAGQALDRPFDDAEIVAGIEAGVLQSEDGTSNPMNRWGGAATEMVEHLKSLSNYL